MRTQQEILGRIEAVSDHDFFGFERNDLMAYLDREHVAPFLEEGANPEEWEPEDQSNIRDTMVDYMPFAWGKACDCRGLSASRSLSHFSAWLWIVGNEELAESIREYECYGKPQLMSICEWLGVDGSQWDDGIRANSEFEADAQRAGN